MGELTAMETQKLQNISGVELKGSNTLCMRTVIPSKGHYEGIIFLSQALKQSEQEELLSIVEKAVGAEKL